MRHEHPCSHGDAQEVEEAVLGGCARLDHPAVDVRLILAVETQASESLWVPDPGEAQVELGTPKLSDLGIGGRVLSQKSVDQVVDTG